ncbi:MAG: adenylate/guanylate cyclase domain-containing protein [Leptospiraceae bacterium]|nr:adenylate/guanylate cyclase domain-containing protein [Leptospiraceae bacterium]
MKTFFRKLVYHNIPENTPIRYRKNCILSNKLALFFLILSFFIYLTTQITTLIGFSEQAGATLNGIFCLLYFISFYINRKGKFQLGKPILIITANLHATLNFLSFGNEVRINWLFLTLFILPLLLYTSNEKREILIFSLIPLIFWGIAEEYLKYNEPFIKMNSEQINFWFWVNTILIFILLWGAFYNFFISTHEAEELFEKEKERSENLLLNILPLPIAEKLKKGEKVIAEHYENTTVLFSDIVGFTQFSANIPPRELVMVLNDLFSEFDDLTKKHKVEKIKTIGDAYMVAGGIPGEDPNHAKNIILFAIDMKKALEKWQKKKNINLGLRIGVHSGDLIAGIIGKNKFIYDIWGDTVNTASRMESHGENGKIHLSSSTYELLKDEFDFIPRGMINVKGKGELNTYFLKV